MRMGLLSLKSIVGLFLALGLLSTPARGGFGEMDMGYGINLLPRASPTSSGTNLQVGTLSWRDLEARSKMTQSNETDGCGANRHSLGR